MISPRHDDELTRRLAVADDYLDSLFAPDLDNEARTEAFRRRVVRQAVALHPVAMPAAVEASAGSITILDGPPVAAAVEGDPQAVERLLAAIRPLVVRYCRARVGRRERSFASADDVAQEVCLAVLTALPSYRDQGRPFLAFVYGIAQHKVADAHRSTARDRAEPTAEMPEEADGGIGPEQHELQRELAERLSQLLEVLPDKQREIVVLRVVVGLSAEEVADAVGSTPGAVRVAQHRALTRLRKVLTAAEVI